MIKVLELYSGIGGMHFALKSKTEVSHYFDFSLRDLIQKFTFQVALLLRTPKW